LPRVEEYKKHLPMKRFCRIVVVMVMPFGLPAFDPEPAAAFKA